MISGATSAMRSGVTTAPRPGLASKVSLMIAVPTMVISTSSPVATLPSVNRSPIARSRSSSVSAAEGDLPVGGRRPALVDGQRRQPPSATPSIGTNAWTHADSSADPQVLAPDERGLVDLVSRARRPRAAPRRRPRPRSGTPTETSHGRAEPRRGARAGRRGSRRAITAATMATTAAAALIERGADLDAPTPPGCGSGGARRWRREGGPAIDEVVAGVAPGRPCAGRARRTRGTHAASIPTTSTARAPSASTGGSTWIPGSTSARRPTPTGPRGDRATAVATPSAAAGTLMAEAAQSAADAVACPVVTPTARSIGPSAHSRRLCRAMVWPTKAVARSGEDEAEQRRGLGLVADRIARGLDLVASRGRRRR